MDYQNIDVRGVTVTVREEDLPRTLNLLGPLASETTVHSGWITDDNPSSSLVGFSLNFDDAYVFADFHNLPYYYRDRWKDYHDRIVANVTRDPMFRQWRGHASRFEPSKLARLIELLGELSTPPQRTSVYAPPPPPTPQNETEMPRFLKDHILELERWATANREDAVQDTLAFWSLKLPAVIASASAGIWAHFDLPIVSVVCGAVASICVVVDGIYPRGMLRNTHVRAYHDIRILASVPSSLEPPVER